MYRISVQDDETVLETVVIVVQHCDYTSCHGAVDLKMIKMANVIFCIF